MVQYFTCGQRAFLRDRLAASRMLKGPRIWKREVRHEPIG